MNVRGAFFLLQQPRAHGRGQRHRFISSVHANASIEAAWPIPTKAALGGMMPALPGAGRAGRPRES